MTFGAFLSAAFENHALIVAISAFLIAQFCKFIITGITQHSFSPERLKGDGGMPSAHSATVMALATVVGYLEGLDSVAFGVSMILASVVMHDALGIRREAGKHASSINELVDTVNGLLPEKKKLTQTEKLKELLGHSLIQVVCGGVLGFLLGLAYILIRLVWIEGYTGFPGHLL